MIHVEVTIESGNNTENQIGIFSVHRTDESICTDGIEYYKYVYGGSWKDRMEEMHFFHGEVFEDRDKFIFSLVKTICEDIVITETW